MTDHPSIKPTAEQLQARLDAIAALAKKYNHAGCNPGTHELANRVLELVEGKR